MSERAVPKKELTLPGICAMCPNIEIPGALFLHHRILGERDKSEFAKAVAELRGVYVDEVPK